MHKYGGMYSFLGTRFGMDLRDPIGMMDWTASGTLPDPRAAKAQTLGDQFLRGRATRACLPMV
jgi:hypothetical protein